MIPLQFIGGIPLAQQAPTVGLQAGTLPAVATTQFDMNSMMNMIMMLMFLVMMVKVMGRVTEGVG